MKFLYDLSWTNKILLLGSLFALGFSAMAGMIAFTMSAQMGEMRSVQTEANRRVVAAFESRLAIVDMAKAQAELISASEPRETREAAVSAIRAFASLDENVQKLQAALPESPKVAELIKLIVDIKPAKMDVIKAARANDDAAALTLSRDMHAAMQQIESLSQTTVHDQIQEVEAALAMQLAAGRKTMVFLAVIMGAGTLILLAASYYAARLFTRPLGMLVDAMGALAIGDLTCKLHYTAKDEVGRTIDEMTKTVGNLNSMVSTIHAGANDLTKEAEGVACAAKDIHEVSGSLHEAVKGMREEALRVRESGSAISQEIACASLTAVNTAQSAVQVTQNIKASVDDFAHFQKEMDDAVANSVALARTAQAVTSITHKIKELASQVNLLALNASIEAARAGEHGRGFAVVADEVRNLARRSDQASGEIADLVDEIVAGVDRSAVRLQSAAEKAKENILRLQTVSGLMQKGSEQATSMHSAMEEVVTLIGSQQTAMESITAAIEDLFTLTEKTSTQSIALDRLSKSLQEASRATNALVEQFRIR